MTDSGTVEGNIILLDDPTGTSGSAGIVGAKSGGTYIIQNNTIVSPERLGVLGIKYAYAATPGVGSKIINNIVQGFDIAFSTTATSGFTVTNNVLFDNAENVDNHPLGSNNYFHNPCLDDYYMPQDIMTHNLGTTGATTDLYGQTFVKSIGAMQADAIDFDDVASNIYWSINGQ